MIEEWPEYGPDTLQNLCLEYCARNIHSFTTVNENFFLVLPDVYLPQGICDKLLALYVEINDDIDDSFIHIFEDVRKTRLSQAKVGRTKISSRAVKWICQHPLKELDLSRCMEVDSDSVSAIESVAKTLRCLKLEANSFWLNLNEWKTESNNLCAQETSPTNCMSELGQGDFLVNESSKKYFLVCPNLTALFLRGFNLCSNTSDLLKRTLCPMRKLSYLDLTGSELNCCELAGLECVPELQSLVLADVRFSAADLLIVLHEICKLKKLRHLDLSWGGEDTCKYTETEENMHYIMRNLPNLVSLDISGTNLAGLEKNKRESHRPEVNRSTVPVQDEGAGCSIPGLEGYRLQFLGLLDCADDACTRQNIPAEKVTGDANESQIVLALQTYMERSNMLTKALNYIFNSFRAEDVRNQCAILEAILAGMKRHSDDRHVQISGSASLYFIVKGDQKDFITPLQKKEIVQAILESMETFKLEQIMLRNGCLTLCHFAIPELLFCYERLVKMLLELIEPTQNDFIIRLSIHLLNCLACQVEGVEKRVVGELGAVTKMLDMIKFKLEQKCCDAIMEVAWSTMWNVTDETPCNCEIFMNNEGMEFFRQCLVLFSDKAELLRNMMGLLGNIAEVPELRCRLMKPEYVIEFSNLLDSESDGIEVSYNAAGVLCHMMSDGEDKWVCEEVDRRDVIAKLVQAIERWPLNSKRNINYRSLEPILRLTSVAHTRSVQHWSVWALCNLTQVYPEKYCPLLEKENGVPILQALLKEVANDRDVCELIQKVLDQHQSYINDNGQAVLNPDQEMNDVEGR